MLDTRRIRTYIHRTNNGETNEMTKTADFITAAYLTPVGVAVAPLRNFAMNTAEERARSIIADIATELAKNGWDINAAAPFPGYHETKGWSQFAKDIARLKYNRFHVITISDRSRPVDYSRNAPSFVVMSPERIEKFVQDAREFAAAQYDMFVLKLNRKIGAHSTATLEGNHVWGESFLTVTFDDGKPIEVWKTQQIWNVSKLGKDFPQWPSRKMKR